MRRGPPRDQSGGGEGNGDSQAPSGQPQQPRPPYRTRTYRPRPRNDGTQGNDGGMAGDLNDQGGNMSYRPPRGPPGGGFRPPRSDMYQGGGMGPRQSGGFGGGSGGGGGGFGGRGPRGPPGQGGFGRGGPRAGGFGRPRQNRPPRHSGGEQDGM